MSNEPVRQITPRLMTLDEAAAYLNIPKTAVKRIGVYPVNVGGRLRWDREAIDNWLDRLSGITPPPKLDGMSAADRAYEEWASSISSSPKAGGRK